MKKNIISLLLLLAISSFFVFYLHNEIPKGLTHDENELARVAFSLENKPYTVFTPLADGHPTPYFYTLLFSFNVFGINQFALRLPSRIFGILNILLFYLILKTLFKKLPITNYLLLITLLLLTSRWFLHFSRVALEVPFLLFTELASIYFVFLFFEKKNKMPLVLSGFFAALAFNSYQPGRIFFLIPLSLLIFKKIHYRQILIYLIAFIIFILPMSVYLLNNPNNDIRINQQFFLKNSSLTPLKKAEFLGANVLNTSLMFIAKGDMRGVHNYTGKPALNPILFSFFFLGFLISLKGYKKIGNFLFLSYFFLSLLPTILTYPWENPNMLRTYTALPSIIYFVGLSLITIINYLKRIKINKYASYLLFVICYLLLLSSTIYEIRTYFKYQPLVFEQSFDKPDDLKTIRQSAHSN